MPMRLTSESPFIWVYNQTVPTKPNLSECLFPIMEETLTSGEYVPLFLISILNMNI